MVEKFALGKLWTGTNTELQIKYTIQFCHQQENDTVTL